MLELATAVTYYEVIEQKVGATEPVLMAADSKGELHDLYAKLSDKSQYGVKSLITEALAACLATDLGICVPQPFIVDITQPFIDSIPCTATKQRFDKSCKKAFGSKVVRSRLVAKNEALDVKNLQAAANIFAFDCLIDNFDRGGDKINCLTDEANFIAIDHEKAFPKSCGIPLLFAKNPWESGALTSFNDSGTHVFLSQIKKMAGKINFSIFKDNWENTISDARLTQYLQALPTDWTAKEPQTANNIIAHITAVRNHIGDCIVEVERVLGVRT